jgi:hypothetical protein
MTLNFKNILNDVTTVTVLFMKSYGEKWKDSRAKFSIKSSRNRSSFVAEHEVSGENDVLYSLTYSEKFDLLAAVNRGKSISLSFDLVSSRVFKILGLMLCI